MMQIEKSYAVVIPMANESQDFVTLVHLLNYTLSQCPNGTIFFVVDNVSIDDTYALCKSVSDSDSRYKTIWAPENRNVVDAYIRGYKEALKGSYNYILEMDAGLSHDPLAIPFFLNNLEQGYQCVFGSRFINGGSMNESNIKRYLLSRLGTILSNILLGTNLKDMTSGFQGFQREVVQAFAHYPLRSEAHFYQTELRYLLRGRDYKEIPIQYKAPSPRVSKKAIRNSFEVLFFYFFKRLKGQSVIIN